MRTDPERDCVLCRWPGSNPGDFNTSYGVANIDLCCNFIIRPLEPYRIGTLRFDTFHHRLTPGPSTKAVAGRERRITTKAWLGDAWRTVSCAIKDGTYNLSIEKIGDYCVGRNEIAALDQNAIPHDDIITGPCLILALAMRGIFTLHASAITLNQGVIAFVAESGAGKSTLAHWVFEHTHGNRGWTRIADDLLPITMRSKRLTALPHFPQSKLGVQDQYTDKHRPCLPVRALFVLGGEVSDETVRVDALPAKQAMLQIIRHTVAARLFGAVLNQAHLAFAARLVQHTPVFRLRYSRRFDALPEVFEQIRGCEATWPASR